MVSPLDIDEWAQVRGYSRLEGSVNPAAMAPLPDRIRQLHLRGRLDEVVKAESGSAFKRRNPQAEFRIVDGNGHGREWVATWRALMREESLPGIRCRNDSDE